MTSGLPSRSVYAGIFAISAATLLFQVTLIRIFSVAIWYHFAFLVVSVALFGIGASGVAVSLARLGPRERRARALAAGLFAVTAVLAYLIVNAIPFSPFRILQEPKQFAFFLLYDLLLMIPFFFSGCAVVLILRAFPARAGRLYAFDLAGAAAGTVLVFALLPLLGARGAVAAAAFLGAVSMVLLAPGRRLRTVGVACAAACLPMVVVPSLLPDVRLDGSKPVTMAIRDGGRHTVGRWNALARIDVVESAGVDPDIFIDGAAATPVTAPRSKDLAGRDLSALAYMLRPGARVAVIGSGGGVDVQNALALGAREVTAIEINPIIIDLVQNRYREHVGAVFEDPRVHLVRDEGRSFIARSRERFDVVQITLIDTWAAGASGAYSLTENYLYTTEAFTAFLRHLDEGGMLSVTRWYYEMPRLTALARSALEATGVSQPAAHVLVLRQYIRSLLLVKRTPFTAAEVEAVRAFADRTRSELAHNPVDPVIRTHYDEYLGATDVRPLIKQAPFALNPVSDESPFFFQMARWKSVSLSKLKSFEGKSLLEPLAVPVAQIVLVSALVLGTLLSLVLLAIPLARRVVPRERRWMWLGYFLALGLAYIVVEVVLMQRFALFLGHPTYAVTVVLFAILLFSGLGAAWSDRRMGSVRRVVLPVLWGLPVAIVLLTFVVPPVLRELLGLPLALRLLVAVLVVGPVAFLMGTPFPTGIRAIAATDSRHIPWAWAANGCASVVGSVCAVLGAMLWSFSVMLLAAGVIYVLAMAVLARLDVELT